MLHTMRFEILLVVAMKINILWDMKPCNLVDRYQLSEGTFFFLVQLQLSFSQDPIFDSYRQTKESNSHRHTIFL